MGETYTAGAGARGDGVGVVADEDAAEAAGFPNATLAKMLFGTGDDAALPSSFYKSREWNELRD